MTNFFFQDFFSHRASDPFQEGFFLTNFFSRFFFELFFSRFFFRTVILTPSRKAFFDQLFFQDFFSRFFVDQLLSRFLGLMFSAAGPGPCPASRHVSPLSPPSPSCFPLGSSSDPSRRLLPGLPPVPPNPAPLRGSCYPRVQRPASPGGSGPVRREGSTTHEG